CRCPRHRAKPAPDRLQQVQRPGATGPMATTIIPPNVQQTPQGGLVFTPGKVVITPATIAPPAAAPAPGGAALGTGANPSPSAPRILFKRTTPARSDLFEALLDRKSTRLNSSHSQISY